MRALRAAARGDDGDATLATRALADLAARHDTLRPVLVSAAIARDALADLKAMNVR